MYEGAVINPIIEVIEIFGPGALTNKNPLTINNE